MDIRTIFYIFCVSNFRDEQQSEKIIDEDAVKPSGWLDDEPEDIPDPDAEKPADWYVNFEI